jgi:hypothetical protein
VVYKTLQFLGPLFYGKSCASDAGKYNKLFGFNPIQSSLYHIPIFKKVPCFV